MYGSERLRVWLFVSASLAGGCGESPTLERPVTPSASQAAERGRRAPQLAALQQLAFVHVVDHWVTAGHPRPSIVCAGVEAGPTLPRRAGWLDGYVYFSFFLDPPLVTAGSRRGSSAGLVGISECEPDDDLQTPLVVLVTGVLRWWDTPDEYDVFVDVLWSREHVGPGARRDRIHLVAVRRTEGWRVVRDAVEQADAADEAQGGTRTAS